MRFQYKFVPNQSDDLHCYQSAIRMAWEGTFGESISAETADRITAFHPGEQTWPFSGMLALAENGALVTNIEDFDARSFAADPATEIRRQAGGDEEIVQHVLSVSDAARQVEIVRDCLKHPGVSFDRRTPSFKDIRQVAQNPSAAIICNVNYCALVGKEGYNGHFVIIDEITDVSVKLQDPGLPPLRDHHVAIETFEQAWSSQDGAPANIIVCVASSTK